jgi:2-isopropylmalate synthase
LGDGPIDAAYDAIDKMVSAPSHNLEDYSIHSVSEGEDALGEVVVKIRSNGRLYVGRGLSTNIIEASILAYINGINKIIEKKQGGEINGNDNDTKNSCGSLWRKKSCSGTDYHG